MLGYFVAKERGQADVTLAALAMRLGSVGIPVAGAVQVNSGSCEGRDCDMDLLILGTGRRIRISQNLGAHSDGCRLDPGGLETAVGLVGAALNASPAPRLLIVNKFGRQEAEGRGFRPLIGEALARGTAVVTAVGADYLPAFAEFAGGMEERLAPDEGALFDWCAGVAA